MKFLPPELRETLAGYSLERVTQSMSGDEVYRLDHDNGGTKYLKIARGKRASRLANEARRTEALRVRGVTVPTTELFTDGKRIAALLMDALPGEPANRSPLPPATIVQAVSSALAMLHALPSGDFPFDESISARLAFARTDIARGDVDLSQFEPHNRLTTPSAIYERLARSKPPEEFVIVHGDATLDNLIAAPDGAIGFIDCGRAGRADRYTDLAVITADIAESFGPEWAEAFMHSYGAPLDSVKAAYFADLYELF